ncbi:hypothetical protein Q4575_06470 [Psychrosphaera sp. 1_MG-2023]|uniref:hypothetical protein n=1 Tax=Psychrosphaera sp. 1_MG-2023 TaxID=3062643 RepID=UPI0026E33761|nr:hypothetical protein [Psychrosphaera sp. 1_MG-2023]MDO6719038.1 hypothetical protein [Psychrosphaera sp. 1_MG-2023]
MKMKIAITQWLFGLVLLGLAPNVEALPMVDFSQANSNCKKNCSMKLTIGKYRQSYSDKSKLELKALYNGVAWAIVSDYIRVSKGKDNKKQYFIHSSKGRKRASLSSICDGQERDITPQGELVCLSATQLLIDGRHFGKKETYFELPAERKVGSVSHNYSGEMAVSFVSEDDFELYVSDLPRVKSHQPWLSAKTALHERSDYSQIIDAKVVPNIGYVAAVYEWVNAYNKGLVIYYFDDKGLVSRGNEHSSEVENIGFEPTIKVTGNKITVTTRNTSERKLDTFEYSKSDLQTMEYNQHDFASGSVVDFMAGGGLQYANWSVNQSVVVNDVEKATTEYDMNTNILKSFFVQGRWGKSQLAVTLLQNEAEDQLDNLTDNQLIRAAVNKYIIQFDYHGLFNGASTLRLGYSTMDAGGTASYMQNGTNMSHAFTSKRETYDALIIAEKGLFLGMYYHQFDSPSVVGFGSHNGAYLGSAFDEAFSMSSLGFKLGFDEAAYGYRYETNYSRFYLNVTGFIGLSNLTVGRDAVTEVTGETKADIIGLNPIELGVSGELGYIWQHRFRALKGFGASFQAGYKVDYYHVQSNWDDEDDFPDDGYFINYDRDDIIHGPYARLNVIF